MPSNLPPFTIRIPEKLMDKFRFLAKDNKRSCNKEIERLMERHVRDYEKRHGEIKVDT